MYFGNSSATDQQSASTPSDQNVSRTYELGRESILCVQGTDQRDEPRAAALAPVIDRPAPWIDYQHLANDVAARGAVSYSWDHGYGPIGWPRS